MNWPRTILDGVAMALLFNAVVGVGFLLLPQAYSTMFPKEIREAENCRAWARKEWLRKQAIPEHALGWTFLACPSAGLIVAALAALIG